MQGQGNVHHVACLLREQITASGLSCEQVGETRRQIEGISVYVMVFEKYYMRASNRASLTVVVSGDEQEVCVDAIGSGGGQGAIFRFSWGAEDSLVGTVEDILRRNGFR